MTDNPYDSPLSITPQLSVEEHRLNAPRPPGISILAILHFVGGVLLFGLQFLLFAKLQAMEESLRAVGIPPMLLVISMMFLAVLTIASGVGMWIGAKWGWWCASFYYIYSVCRNASALLTIIAVADQFDGGARGPEYYIMKHTGRIVIHSLLFLYFFKGNVLEYFGLETLSKLKAIAILIGVCIAITAAASAVSFLST